MPIIIPRSLLVQKPFGKLLKWEEANLEDGDLPRHEAEEPVDVIGETASGKQRADKKDDGRFREWEWKA